jgi:alkanesulfonate monooxygenase SsuD/methylene tetrahydromethanopterin reductase-like flavin-dependent oxidoreductase (luciferase family)
VQFTAYDITSSSADGASAWRPVEAWISDPQAYRETLHQARLADEAGLDGYFLTEHHFNPGFQIVPSPNVLLGALSQVTSRIRLGAMTLNLPLYHPVRAAEEIRMLDILSGGRLEVGLGRGLAGHEHAGFGVERSNSEELFDQGFALLRSLLTDGEVASYAAGPWSGHGVTLVPQPTQLPHPPFWLAAMSDKSIRKAARLGVNLCTAFLDAESVGRTSRVYREEWRQVHGSRPAGMYGTLQHIFVAETGAEARRLGQPHLEAWLSAGHEAATSASRSSEVDRGYEDHKQWFDKVTKLPFDAAVDRGRIIFGTPEQCTQQLVRKAEGGVDMFQGWFRFGGLDFEASNRSLQLFCQEVVPAVRAAVGAAPVSA